MTGVLIWILGGVAIIQGWCLVKIGDRVVSLEGKVDSLQRTLSKG